MCEVFKLQQYVRPALFHSLDKFINEFIVFIVSDTRITPAHIQRIVKQLLVVGADIQHHRKGIGRTDAATGGIERQFTERNLVLHRDVLQNIVHIVAVLVRDKHTA